MTKLTRVTKDMTTNLLHSVSTLSALQSMTNIMDGEYITTDGYYSVGDGGAAAYLISDSVGAVPELAFPCSNGKYAILQHKGVITLEQLGAKGDSVDTGSQPVDDSWPAFYKAYLIKKTSLYGYSIKFVTTKSAYYCSKPVLMCTGMVLSNNGSPWITRIYYGGQKVTPAEVPTVPGLYPPDAAIVYSDITAACMFVHNTGLYCNYSTLEGFKFVRATGVSSLGFGIYAPYASKLTSKDVRVEGAYIGLYSRDIWGSVIDGTVLMGLDPSVPPQPGSVGVKIEPYLGVDAFEAGGTSNTYRCVGTSGFQTGFKITRQAYSTLESCYSEKGNDIAIEFHGSDGISITGFGLENLSNTAFSAIRFYNTRASIDSLTFQFNCTIAGGNIVWLQNRSIVSIQNISFGRVTNTGSSISLFSISSDSQLDLGAVDVPASLISSAGYSFASVAGKLMSGHVFAGTLGIANGSATVNSVTFTNNQLSYKFKGDTVWFNYFASWTGGSGTDMQVYGFPSTFTKEATFHSSLPAVNKVVYARTLLATNRVRISGAADASNTSIPATGSLFIQGEYTL